MWSFTSCQVANTPMNCSVGSAERKLRSRPSPVRAKGTGRVQKASTSQALAPPERLDAVEGVAVVGPLGRPEQALAAESISCRPTRVSSSPPRPSCHSFDIEKQVEDVRPVLLAGPRRQAVEGDRRVDQLAVAAEPVVVAHIAVEPGPLEQIVVVLPSSRRLSSSWNRRRYSPPMSSSVRGATSIRLRASNGSRET